MIVRDFSSRKVSDYLASGKYHHVLIKFHHGLGDAIAFIPCFDMLKSTYPSVSFSLGVHCGQNEIFGEVTENESAYDIVFEIGFPCSEWDHPEYTKAEYCCKIELGIPVPNTEPLLEKAKSPLVGVHFFSTCMPDKLGCPEFIARRIRDQIIDSGLVPIDTHMSHSFDNPVNQKFNWENCTIRDAHASCRNLLGVISGCCGFAGVASGNFHAALSVMPEEDILFIKTDFSVSCLTRKSVLQLDISNYDEGIVRAWLSRVKRRIGR